MFKAKEVWRHLAFIGVLIFMCVLIDFRRIFQYTVSNYGYWVWALVALGLVAIAWLLGILGAHLEAWYGGAPPNDDANGDQK